MPGLKDAMQVMHELGNQRWKYDKGDMFYFRWLHGTEVMIDRDSWGRQYSEARGEILGPSED